MTNPLTFFPARVRQIAYVTYAVIAVILGATQVGYASADVGTPVFVSVAFDVLGYLGLVLGLTAAANTTTTPAAPIPVEVVDLNRAVSEEIRRSGDATVASDKIAHDALVASDKVAADAVTAEQKLNGSGTL